MSRKPTKVQRLVRLNAFREERADDALRLAVKQQDQAREEHATAQSDVESIGQWKTPVHADTPIDLAAYDQALELERRAMEKADVLRQRLSVRERSTEQARKDLSRAVSAARVSNHRRRREVERSNAEEEKRAFDEVSDVWLNNRKPAHE